MCPFRRPPPRNLISLFQFLKSDLLSNLIWSSGGNCVVLAEMRSQMCMPSQGHFYRPFAAAAVLPTHARRNVPALTRFYQFYPRKAVKWVPFSAKSGLGTRGSRGLPRVGARGRGSERSACLPPRFQGPDSGRGEEIRLQEPDFRYFLPVPHAFTPARGGISEKADSGRGGSRGDSPRTYRPRDILNGSKIACFRRK